MRFLTPTQFLEVTIADRIHAESKVKIENPTAKRKFYVEFLREYSVQVSKLARFLRESVLAFSLGIDKPTHIQSDRSLISKWFPVTDRYYYTADRARPNHAFSETDDHAKPGTLSVFFRWLAGNEKQRLQVEEELRPDLLLHLEGH